MSRCAKCNGELEQTGIAGGTINGPFVEEYRCKSCSARGYITGEASESPDRWDRNGTAFQPA